MLNKKSHDITVNKFVSSINVSYITIMVINEERGKEDRQKQGKKQNYS